MPPRKPAALRHNNHTKDIGVVADNRPIPMSEPAALDEWLPATVDGWSAFWTAPQAALLLPARSGAEAWGSSEHVVELTGEAHTWRVRYPGPDRRLGTADDVEGTGDLHVPRDVPTRIVLRSRDYVYTLRVPRLGVDDVAVPDIAGELRLQAAASGTYALEGGQMCGVAYPGLQGHVVVHDGSGYWAALRRAGAR